jgi:hypothetical protein
MLLIIISRGSWSQRHSKNSFYTVYAVCGIFAQEPNEVRSIHNSPRHLRILSSQVAHGNTYKGMPFTLRPQRFSRASLPVFQSLASSTSPCFFHCTKRTSPLSLARRTAPTPPPAGNLPCYQMASTRTDRAASSMPRTHHTPSPGHRSYGPRRTICSPGRGACESRVGARDETKAAALKGCAFGSGEHKLPEGLRARV